MTRGITTIAGQFSEIYEDSNNGAVQTGSAAAVSDGSRQVVAASESTGFKNEEERNARGAETLTPYSYYIDAVLPVLKRFVANIEDKDLKDHYDRILDRLGSYLRKTERFTNLSETESLVDIERLGGERLTQSVKEFYQWQLKRSVELVGGYVVGGLELEPKQQKALLAYVEYVLNLMEACCQQKDVDKNQAVLAANQNLKDALEKFGFEWMEVKRLVGYFGQVANFVDFSLAETCERVMESIQDYEPPDSGSASLVGGVKLSSQQVLDQLRVRSHQVEGAHRLIVEAIDSLRANYNPTERQPSPKLDVGGGVLENWEELVKKRIAKEEGLDKPRPLQSDDYINGILGSRKEGPGFLGIPLRYQLKHHIKNVEYKAPVRTLGSRKDRLESVQAAEIAIVAGVWEGEWKRGSMLRPGESAPKEFFGKIVDVTVWSTILNNPDAVENFINQLESAQAVELEGESVKNIIGSVSDFPNAEAYRIPVLNHKGEPAFLVVDRDTYKKMLKVAQVSRNSYAELAKRDSRYVPRSRDERYKAFSSELKENILRNDNWVDRERDFIAVESIQREVLASLDEGNEVEHYVAEQVRAALEKYRELFNDFQRDFGRESRYREIAAQRLKENGITADSVDFDRLLAAEIEYVAKEFVFKWNAFRYVGDRVCYAQKLLSNPDLGYDEAYRLKKELLELLANLDYEYEIRFIVLSKGKGQNNFEAQVRETVSPFMRRAKSIFEDGVQDSEISRATMALKGLEGQGKVLGETIFYAKMMEMFTSDMVGVLNPSLVEDFSDAIESMNDAKTDLLGFFGVLMNNYSGYNLSRLSHYYSRSYKRATSLALPHLPSAKARFVRLIGRDTTPEENNRYENFYPPVLDKRSEIIGKCQADALFFGQPIEVFGLINRFISYYVKDDINSQSLENLSQEEQQIYLVLAIAASRSLKAFVSASSYDIEEPARLYQEDESAIRLTPNLSFQKPGRVAIVTFENTINEYAKIIPGLAERLRTSLA